MAVPSFTAFFTELYHGAMAFGTSRNFTALCLVPPSNIARELALYKRRLFESHGLASALLWPEMAILAWVTKESSGGLSLQDFWKGIPGKFEAGKVKAEADGFYLGLQGAFPALSARIARSPCIEAEVPPFTAGSGFFLCGREGEGLPGILEQDPPLPFSFHAADLALYRISLPEVCPLEALAWTRLRLAHRPRANSKSL
jgi:hypothetical protein